MKPCPLAVLILLTVGSMGEVFAEVPNAATRAFLQAHPGTTTMVENDRVVAIHGATFASDNDPNTNTDQFVSAFLAANGAALGIAPLDLVFKDKVSIRFGQGMVYTYTQRIETMPVYASVVKISVALGPTEKIGYIGIRLVPPPANPLPADRAAGGRRPSVQCRGGGPDRFLAVRQGRIRNRKRDASPGMDDLWKEQ